MKLAENPMPEVTDAYSVSHEQEPEATIKVYKVFTLDKDGDPSALFVSGKDKLPMGVWLNAQDTWHFTAANGKDYVPSTRNPNGRGSKTGSSVLIPNEQVRQELIQRGFLPEGSKAKYITALAYRPGWHAADLPYFHKEASRIRRATMVMFIVPTRLSSSVSFLLIKITPRLLGAKQRHITVMESLFHAMPTFSTCQRMDFTNIPPTSS